MMRNLIAQLLSACPDFDLTNIGRLQDVDTEDVEDVCEIMQDLVLQLTEQYIVFCILDNVTVCEHRDEWKEEAEIAMSRLAMLTKPDSGIECTFKLLLTSATKSTFLYHTLAKDNVLFMPEKVPAMARMTERAWKNILMQKVPGDQTESEEPKVNDAAEPGHTEADPDSDSSEYD